MTIRQSSSGRPSIVLDGIIFGLQKHGGISNYWARLTEHLLSREVQLVVPRTVHAADYQPAWDGQLNLHRETLPVQLSRYLTCSGEAADVFHTSYYRLPRRRPKRYVVTCYDFIYERHRRGLSRFVHSQQKMRSLAAADRIACISSYVRDQLLSFLPFVDPQQAVAIPLGVDHGSFFSEVQAPDGELARTVLYVGRREGYKRFDLAVSAVRACSSEIHLGIVGPPLADSEIQNLRTALPGRWRHLGAVDTGALRRIYSSAFAFIYPSDDEGFGLPMLEAMACGCPVVASSRGSLPEVGGEAAVFAAEQHGESYAACIERLTNTTARLEFQQLGLTRSKEFDWKYTFERTEALYAV